MYNLNFHVCKSKPIGSWVFDLLRFGFPFPHIYLYFPSFFCIFAVREGGGDFPVII